MDMRPQRDAGAAHCTHLLAARHPLANLNVDAALLAWRGNRAMIDDVVAARRVALDTRLKHLRLAADRAQAQYDIDYLAGEIP